MSSLLTYNKIKTKRLLNNFVRTAIARSEIDLYLAECIYFAEYFASSNRTRRKKMIIQCISLMLFYTKSNGHETYYKFA